MSSQISEFLKLMEQTKTDYGWAIEEADQQEKLTQDYLHKLELMEIPYHEQAKIARKLKGCRTQRRQAKDFIAAAEPVVDFLNSERGEMLLNQLRQVLGKVRKAEKNAALRQYTPRVMSMEEYAGKDRAGKGG